MDLHLNSGTKAWLGLVTYIAAYDVYAAKTGRETLSSAFYAAIKHPINRWPVILIWAYITAHLFKWIPDWCDPLRRGAYVKRLRLEITTELVDPEPEEGKAQ